ncbi:hypothetical protein LCGC14_1147790 [marine sediment metagenome]|uniref:VRR-NUC domain-containing protein n=1 Tax=marine sediment metagenome TaxID=412755 RepID=A0A0F9Q211_9ZZZZ
MKLNPLDITEKQFESQVKDLAKTFNWQYYHTWRSIHSPAGFPDCVMVKEGRIIFAELKSEKGKVSEEQFEWLEALGKGKAEVYIWRPSDFDKVVEILR